MLWSSYYGKLLLRDKLLNQLSLKGDEKVLDIGCGSGLLSIGLAKKLSAEGHITGIDLWHSKDLSNNTIERAQTNIALADASEKITLITEDMRQLTFKDNQFELIISSMAIHNLKNPADRHQALQEMVRTLKPGGTIALWDIFHVPTYQKILSQAGLQTMVSSLQFYVFPPARILVAQKIEPSTGSFRH